MSEKPDLLPKQARAISALVVCRTLGDAARQAKVGESTLRRWLAKDAAFQAAWREARTALLDNAVAQALRSAEAAALTLHDRMLRADSDYARIAAAKALLDISMQTVERGDFEQRIHAIMQSMEELRRAYRQDV